MAGGQGRSPHHDLLARGRSPLDDNFPYSVDIGFRAGVESSLDVKKPGP